MMTDHVLQATLRNLAGEIERLDREHRRASRRWTGFLLVVMAPLLVAATVTIKSADLLIDAAPGAPADSFEIYLRGMGGGGGSRDIRLKNDVVLATDYRFSVLNDAAAEIFQVNDDGDALVPRHLTANGDANLGDGSTDKVTARGEVTTAQLNKVVVVDGTTYTTIQAALNALPASGGKVYIPAGDYDVSAAALTLPAGVNEVRIEGAGGKSTRIYSTVNTHPLLDVQGRSGIRIENVTFDLDAPLAAAAVGIRFDDTAPYSGVSVQDCTFLDLHTGVLVEGSLAAPAAEIWITGSRFVGCQHGVYLDGTVSGQAYVSKAIVRANVFECNGLANSYGIFNRFAKRTVIAENIVQSARAYGIFSTDGDRNPILGNIVYDATLSAIFSDGESTSISGNVVDSCAAAGIENRGLASAIGSNVVHDSRSHGILNTATAAGSTIAGNALWDPGDQASEYGIYNQATGVSISANDVYYDTATADGAEGIYSTGDRTAIAGNVVFDSNDDGIENTGSEATIVGNSIYSCISTGIRNQGVRTTIAGNGIHSPGASGILHGAASADNCVNAGNAISSPGSGFAIYVNGAAERHVVGCNGIYAGHVDLQSSPACAATGNVVDGSADSGISAGGTGTSITGNAIYDAGSVAGAGDAIYAYGPATTVGSNAVSYDGGTDGSHGIRVTGSNGSVTGNTIWDAPGEGVHCQTGDGNTITGNAIWSSGSAGLFVRESHDTALSGNTVVQPNGHGIYQFGAAGTTDRLAIHGNVVSAPSGAGRSGIYQSAGDHYTISGNVIYEHTSHGMTLNGGSHHSISGNTVYCTQGDANQGIDLNAVTHSTVSANAISGNKYCVYFGSSSGFDVVTGNALHNGYTAGAYWSSTTPANQVTFVGNRYTAPATGNTYPLYAYGARHVVAGNDFFDPNVSGASFRFNGGTDECVLLSNQGSLSSAGTNLLSGDTAGAADNLNNP